MRPPSLIPVLGLACAIVASARSWVPPPYDRYAPLKKGIDFTTCDDDFPEECGVFDVYLDYKNPSAGKAQLAVIRRRATMEKKGTLFTNPGGPGVSGVESERRGRSENLLRASGGYYDIVSWDPRGVNLTYPRADCFASQTERYEFLNGTVLLSGIEVPSHLPNDDDLVDYFTQVSKVDDTLLELGQRCTQYSPDILQYVGSAATVRDMVAIHDHLEPNMPLVNFWGFSYGTIIGIYFANMFPERVGRLILDGVVDPEFYAEKPPHQFWPISIQAANVSFNGFLEECTKAGPGRCMLAAGADTPLEMHDAIMHLIDGAYDYQKANSSALFGSAHLIFGLVDTLMDGMYRPRGWANMAIQLVLMLTSLPEPEAKLLLESSWSRHSSVSALTGKYDGYRDDTKDQKPASYALQAITCGDAIDAGSVTTKDVFFEILGTMGAVDRIFGPSFGDAGFYCHRWPVRAIERYTGPWNKKPANKILVIGNEGDPITPLTSAKFVAGTLGGENAVLIEQNSYGHCSLAMHSNCTMNVIETYFVNGTLPGSFQKVCGTDEELFPLLKVPEEPEEPNVEHKRWHSVLTPLGCAFALALFYLALSYVRRKKTNMHTYQVQCTLGASEKADLEKGPQNNLFNEPMRNVGV